MITAWAIRRKDNHHYLPMLWKSVGYSIYPSHTWQEPRAGVFPRLFRSKRSAQAALTAWLQGKWSKASHYSTDYGDYSADYGDADLDIPVPDRVEGRRREDMEIVELRLEVVSP